MKTLTKHKFKLAKTNERNNEKCQSKAQPKK